MGVDLGDLIKAEELDLNSLAGKKIAVDAFNTIYQFLSIIRQHDGTPLMDSRGKITSHLSGIFYRNMRLMEIGVLPCYVFDGKPPQLKADTLKKRKATKEKAQREWTAAKDRGDMEGARKYAQATSKLTEDMLNECKELLDALGLPWVQSPGEGEAQAAHLCKERDVFAAASQDFDSLLFGAPKLVRNVNITGKRKLPRRNVYIDVNPEMLELDKALAELKLSQEQLIEIGIMVGTDFNPGIKGIGPKKALQHIRQKPISAWAKELDFGVDPLEVKKIFTEPEITKDYSLKWGAPNEEKLTEILHERHDFSKERITNALEKLGKAAHAKDQKSLADFF
ncbi:MAG: flap endonuclease-1 [archaeon]